MANSYTLLYYHIVFATKYRIGWIIPEYEKQIWGYLGGIAKNNGMVPLAIGGIEDHVHLVIRLNTKTTLCMAIQLLKGGSSKWIHEQFPGLADFRWQNGYGAFTISHSSVERTIRYVLRQRVHHCGDGYQEEYLKLLKLHGIEPDPKYLWD